MNNKLKIGLLLLIVVALISAPEVAATRSFASATGASCGTCHNNPSGGGSLTAAGNAYSQTGNLPATVTPPLIQPVTPVIQPATQQLITNALEQLLLLLQLQGIQPVTQSVIFEEDYVDNDSDDNGVEEQENDDEQEGDED